MAYAKEYIEKYYPTHEVVYAVLKYRYVSDGIENYVVPVSYTHLDVYKRQPADCGLSSSDTAGAFLMMTDSADMPHPCSPM